MHGEFCKMQNVSPPLKIDQIALNVAENCENAFENDTKLWNHVRITVYNSNITEKLSIPAIVNLNAPPRILQ